MLLLLFPLLLAGYATLDTAIVDPGSVRTLRSVYVACTYRHILSHCVSRNNNISYLIISNI